VTTGLMPALAVMSDPKLPAVKGKIQSADDHPCKREDGCRNVWIDELIQVMEQEPALVRLDSGFGFKPVLKHGQRARPGKHLRKYPPDERSDMQEAENRSRARQQSTEDHPQNEKHMQEENENRER